MSSSVSTSASKRVTISALAQYLCVFAVGLTGIVRLPAALTGDQALYQMGAQRLASGAKYYIDFWDTKNPGIYWFHYLAGSLFGWGELGLHTLELICQLLLAVVVMKLLLPWLQHQWLAPLGSLVVVGGYYAAVDDWHLTQPAAVLMLPLSLVAYFVIRARRERNNRFGWHFAAGLVGSITLIFKDECAVLILAMLSTTLWLDGNGYAPAFSTRIKTLGWGVLGMLLGTAAFVVCCWTQGSLRMMVWTMFVYPTQAAKYHHFFPVWRIVWAATWFGQTFWPICVATLCMILRWPFRRQQPITTLLGVWLIAGLVTIVFEQFAWWPFDILLILPPVGAIAIIAVDEVLTKLNGTSWHMSLLRIGIVAVLLLPSLRSWQARTRQVLPWLIGNDSSEAFRARVNTDYRSAQISAQFLKDSSAAPGPVYVVGNPNLARLGERAQIGRIHGWGWEIFLPSQLDEAARDIKRHRPSYIYLGHEYDELVRSKVGSLASWIESEYPYRRVEPDGTWFSHQYIPPV